MTVGSGGRENVVLSRNVEFAHIRGWCGRKWQELKLRGDLGLHHTGTA
jgi:hypothetical protein